MQSNKNTNIFSSKSEEEEPQTLARISTSAHTGEYRFTHNSHTQQMFYFQMEVSFQGGEPAAGRFQHPFCNKAVVIPETIQNSFRTSVVCVLFQSAVLGRKTRQKQLSAHLRMRKRPS
jgi:hypothetical protein